MYVMMYTWCLPYIHMYLRYITFLLAFALCIFSNFLYIYILHGSFANGIYTAGFCFLFSLTVWLLAGIFSSFIFNVNSNHLGWLLFGLAICSAYFYVFWGVFATLLFFSCYFILFSFLVLNLCTLFMFFSCYSDKYLYPLLNNTKTSEPFHSSTFLLIINYCCHALYSFF